MLCQTHAIGTSLFYDDPVNSVTGLRSRFVLCALVAFLLQLLTTWSVFVFFQIITYRDYLPGLLGKETSKWIPLYRGYNESVDPRISNVFTLAFRFGHASVQPFVSRLNDSFQPLGSFSHVPLHLTFCATWRIVMEGKNVGEPALLVWSWSRHRWRSAGKTHEPWTPKTALVPFI